MFGYLKDVLSIQKIQKWVDEIIDEHGLDVKPWQGPEKHDVFGEEALTYMACENKYNFDGIQLVSFQVLSSSSENEYVGYAKHGTLRTHHGLESVKWKFTSKQSLEDLFKSNLSLATPVVVRKEKPPPVQVAARSPVVEDFERIETIKAWTDEIFGERGISPSDVKGPVDKCVTYHLHEDMCIYERPESTESVAVTFYCPLTEISITAMDDGAKIQIYNANGSLDHGFFVTKEELERHVDAFIARVVRTPVRVNHAELWARAQEETLDLQQDGV